MILHSPRPGELYFEYHFVKLRWRHHCCQLCNSCFSFKDEVMAHFAQCAKETQNVTLTQLKAAASEGGVKEDFTWPPFAIISMYVGNCEECVNSVVKLAANLIMQTSECTVYLTINLTIFFSCLSELWERAYTLNKHIIGTLLLLIHEKKILVIKRIFHRKKSQENNTDKGDRGCHSRQL